ncbi:hypothetical protein QQF64_011786 [Cirrhinus molitorella]|uniref:Transporter n=1 Tax=Cirrhinus molitorella TaxID=172907 RepID=A0ABR3LW50_9TELE
MDRIEGQIEERGYWGSKAEFLLAVAGNVVGLGNVWRFPYLCYKYGGGAFLIPYLVFVFTCGVPLFLLETAMGQYTQEGGITCWHRLCPLAEGIGYAGQLILLYSCMYYIIILAWALFYLVFSFSSQLPWASCDNTWNTDAECCLSLEGLRRLVVYFTATFPYVMLLVLLIRGLTLPGALQGVVFYLYPEPARLSDPQTVSKARGRDPGCRYMNIVPVKIGGKQFVALVDTGSSQTLVREECIRDLQMSSQEVPQTSTGYSPFELLYGRQVHGPLDILKEAWEGERLKEQVWLEAGAQILFSYSVSVGALTVLASYNKYNNNCYRDSLWLCLLNSCTSFVAGFAVFSVLGFMSQEQGVPIAEVAESGPGLAFIAYPQAVAMMPLPQFWAVCFFIMIILLGLDTQFVAMEAVTTSVMDLFPMILRRPGRRECFLLLFCLTCFLGQFIMVTEGGMYVFQLFDYYACNGACVLFLSVFESLAMGWIFGAERMFDIIEDMTKSRPNYMFMLCWKYLTPLVSLVSFVCSLVEYTPLTFNRWYVYPDWAYALGWLLALSSIVLVPGWALGQMFARKGSLKQRWHHLCSPDKELPLTCKQTAEMKESAEMEDLVQTDRDEHENGR